MVGVLWLRSVIDVNNRDDITLRDEPKSLSTPFSFRPLLLLIAGLLLLSCSEKHSSDDTVTAGQGTTIVDAFGDTITLSESSPTLLSLAPNLTEIVYALGDRDNLLARTDYCDYPAVVSRLESIGTLGTYNYERMLALRPDLVLMMTFDGSSRAEYDRLKELGLRPVAFAEGDVPAIIRMIDTVGTVIGRSKEATALTNLMTSRLDSIAEVVASEEPVPTFIVIEASPLITVSGDFVTSMLTIAGGRNVVAGDPLAYPRYSRESLLRANPEAIILPSIDPGGGTKFLGLYPEVAETSAGRNGKIRVIDPNLISRPGPRMIEGIIELRALLGR